MMFSLFSNRDEWRHLKNILLHLGRKDLWIALAWIILYFCTQWVAQGVTMLWSLPIGVAAGIVIGWWLAEEAVDTAGFSGLFLWVLLILAAWLPPALVEGILGLITGWSMGFGRWMLFSSTLIMGMAATVWRALPMIKCLQARGDLPKISTSRT